MRRLPGLVRALWPVALLLALPLAAQEKSAPVEQASGTTFAPQSTLLRRGKEVTALAVAPDGNSLAIVRGSPQSSAGELQLWSLALGKARVTLPCQPPVLSVVFSPDSKTLATGDASGAIQLRDPVTGKVKRRLHGHSGAVGALIYTPDGKHLVSGSDDSTIAVWSPGTAEVLRWLRGHLDAVHALASVANNMAPQPGSGAAPMSGYASATVLVASGSRDHTARVWDLHSGKELQTFRGHGAEVTAVCFEPGFALLITASLDGSTRFWSTRQQLPPHQPIQGLQPFSALAFTHNNNSLILASREGGLHWAQVHPYANQHPVRSLVAGEPVSTVAFTPDGRTLITGGTDGTVKLWDFNPGVLKLRAPLASTATVTASSPILAAACSPDGKLLAVGGEGKTVDLLDAATGQVQHRLSGHEDVVNSVAFSPDGKLLATASLDGTIKLWDSSDGTLRTTLRGHEGWVFAVAFHPDGKTLASGGADRTIRMWDVGTGKERTSFSGHEAGVRCLAFNEDGTLLASGSSDRTVRLWDSNTGQVRAILKGHEGMVRAVAFRPDGARLASGSEDNTVRLWDVGQKKQLTSHTHFDRVMAVAFSTSGDVLLSGSLDQTIAVLDPTRAAVRIVLTGHTDGVSCLVPMPDGRRLISGGVDGNLRVWTTEAAGARPQSALVVPGGLQRFVALGGDGDLLATAAEDKAVILHRLEMHSTYRAPQEPTPLVFGVTYSPDGKTLAVCCLDGTVRLYNAATGQRKQTLNTGSQVWNVVFTPDSKSLVSTSGSWDNKQNPGSTKLWDLTTGKEKASYEGHTGVAFSISLSPDGKTLATASWDQTVRLWDVASGKEKATLRGHNAPVRAVAFSPVGSLLASGGWDGSVRLWDPVKHKELRSLTAPLQGINHIAFTPDGKTLAVAYNPYNGNFSDPFNASSPEHGGVLLWDVARRKELRRIESVRGKVLGVAFSPDGKRLVTGGGASRQFAEVKLWETATGKELSELHGPTYWVEGITFSPDGQVVASGGGSPTGPSLVNVWTVSIEMGRRTLGKEKITCLCAAYSPDAKLLAVGDATGKLQLWDVARGTVQTTLRGHDKAIIRLSFSADGKSLASASDDHSVRVWDVQKGTTKWTVEQPDRDLLDVALSPDGKQVAVCTAKGVDGSPGEVHLWAVAGNKEQEDGERLGKDPLCVSWSPDSKLLAIATAEDVEVWKAEPAKLLRRFAGIRGARALAFTPDGRTLAASQDAGARAVSSVALLDLDGGKTRILVAATTARLFELHFSVDGGRLTACGSEGVARLWKLGK